MDENAIDAARYRRLRELIEYGDFRVVDASDGNLVEIEYAHALDAALDKPKAVLRGDSLARIRAAKQGNGGGPSDG